MVSVVLGMLVCLGFALVVMALVAVPARRQGREVLTERGEEVLESIRERQLPGRPDKPSVAAERDPEPVGILG
jgi:hypothetical protein